MAAFMLKTEAIHKKQYAIGNFSNNHIISASLVEAFPFTRYALRTKLNRYNEIDVARSLGYIKFL